ncbi:hypothetical protein [Algoriphagus yeomjeoni]|uniref:Uncharacterized protein n=1 Tax=Algoriphagus yeomjeoni TaxID=291403 RepID=A0A327PCW2_9BACT|nr:hypothetical protein [Algoriphagus yeomjeoni]RAI89327.1 hypothetical protein LV83_02368 [Algoriphagus yeomjeoni]
MRKIEINQKKLFTSRKMVLLEEGFTYTENGIFNQFIEAEIPYEELQTNTIYKHSQIPIFWLLMTGMSGFFFFVLFFSKITIPETKADWSIIIGFGIATTAFSFLSFMNWVNEVYISTAKATFILFRTKANQNEVDSFIKELKLLARCYVKEKYLNSLKGDFELRTTRVEWLYETGFISKDEFEELQGKSNK